MNRKIEKILTLSLAAGSFIAPLGLGLWKVIQRKKGKSVPDKPVKATYLAKPKAQTGSDAAAVAPPLNDEQLESLSFQTPGDAPLDRIARRAHREQHEEDQLGHSGLKTPVPPGSGHPRPAGEKNVAGLLEHQSLASYRLEGWNLPAPERLPVPTYAPAVMAFGIVVFAMGLATVWYVCVVGALVFAVAAWRWTGELQGE